MKKSEKNLVAVVMGSQSDWETMKDTEKVLNELNIKYGILVDSEVTVYIFTNSRVVIQLVSIEHN